LPAKVARVYTLYYSPGAASMVVHLALLETGAPYRLERVDLAQPRSAAYLQLNPQGQVPTLLAEGRALTESVAILIWLAERHTNAKLAPLPGDPLHGECLQWLVSLSNSLMATFRFWFYPRDLGHEQHPPELRAALQARIEATWQRIDALLALRGPYLLGERFCSADLLLTMLMRWSRRMPRTALDWPALAQLATRVRARPSWQKLYELEELKEW
jgi:glutathione S-transferase